MIDIDKTRSTTYAQARSLFLQSSGALGAQLSCYRSPSLGPEGEDLATDVAWLPTTTPASSLLILSNGLTGVGGFDGSSMMAFTLHDKEWLTHCADHGMALLWLHALHPYRMAWGQSGDGVDAIPHPLAPILQPFLSKMNPLRIHWVDWQNGSGEASTFAIQPTLALSVQDQFEVTFKPTTIALGAGERCHSLGECIAISRSYLFNLVKTSAT